MLRLLPSPVTLHDAAADANSRPSTPKRPASPPRRPPRPEALVRALIREDPALAERFLRLVAPTPPLVHLARAEHAYAVVRPLLAGRATEALVCLAMDSKHRVIESAILTTGSASATVVDPAQIYRWALTRSRQVCSIILAHNHPSGDVTPSPADINLTALIAEVGRTLAVPLFDHLIVGDPDRWCSMAQLGLMPPIG